MLTDKQNMSNALCVGSIHKILRYSCTRFQDLKHYGATTVVRVCDITYDKTPLEKDGITVVVSKN